MPGISAALPPRPFQLSVKTLNKTTTIITTEAQKQRLNSLRFAGKKLSIVTIKAHYIGNQSPPVLTIKAHGNQPLKPTMLASN